MAEIKIEKKKPIWPWILALLLIALILYFLFFKETTVINEETTTNDTIVNTTEMVDEGDISDDLTDVAAFVAFLKNDNGNMTLDHQYSHDALMKLIDATEEISEKSGFDSKIDLDNARNFAHEISKNPDATNHADNIKKSTDIISKVLQNVQKAKFSTLNAEAEKVKMSSAAINVKELALNQKEKIKNFFNDAADLLDKMNR